MPPPGTIVVGELSCSVSARQTRLLCIGLRATDVPVLRLSAAEVKTRTRTTRRRLKFWERARLAIPLGRRRARTSGKFTCAESERELNAQARVTRPDRFVRGDDARGAASPTSRTSNPIIAAVSSSPADAFCERVRTCRSPATGRISIFVQSKFCIYVEVPSTTAGHSPGFARCVRADKRCPWFSPVFVACTIRYTN